MRGAVPLLSIRALSSRAFLYVVPVSSRLLSDLFTYVTALQLTRVIALREQEENSFQLSTAGLDTLGQNDLCICRYSNSGRSLYIAQ